jgi:hypothetical protein
MFAISGDVVVPAALSATAIIVVALICALGAKWARDASNSSKAAMAQTQPNGGHSQRDSINRIEADVKSLVALGKMQGEFIQNTHEETLTMRELVASSAVRLATLESKVAAIAAVSKPAPRKKTSPRKKPPVA